MAELLTTVPHGADARPDLAGNPRANLLSVHLQLSQEEATALKASVASQNTTLSAVFKPALRTVLDNENCMELIYNPAEQPFGVSDHQQIANACLVQINEVLAHL